MQKKQENIKLSIFSDLVGQNGIFCDGDWIESKDQNKDGEVRLIQLSDIGDGFFRNKSNRFLTLKRAKELRCTFLEAGDILIARMPDPLGRSCIFPLQGKEKYVTAVDVCIVRVDGEISDNKFVCHIINSPAFRNSINKLESGTTRKRISRKNLNTIEFLIPKISIQHQIVSKIEELFSDLDKGKQQLETVRQQLKTYRHAVLKWAFEGRFTSNAGTGRDLSSDDQYKSQLPEGWNWVKIMDIAETIGGYAFKSSGFKSVGKYQVIRMGNIRPGIFRLSESPVFLDEVDKTVLNRALLKVNDLVITQTGTRKKRDYGFTALVSFPTLLLNQRLTAIRCKENYLPKFLLYFSWTDFFKDQFFANETGNVGQGNVGMKAIMETLIPFCNLSDQNQIINEIESRLSVCDKMEEIIETSLKQSESLRQSILKQAFDGRLV